MPDNGADRGVRALMSFVTGAVICLKSLVNSRRAVGLILFNAANASLTPTTSTLVEIAISVPCDLY
jgi:hypothetical protein